MTSTIRTVRRFDPIFVEKGKSEKKLRYPIKGIHTTTSQRVQPGTKRPSGKRDKNKAARTLPRKITRRADHCQTQGLPANPLIVVLGLPSTSRRATSSANQSLDLPQVRQKITAPTPNHSTAWAMMSVALTAA